MKTQKPFNHLKGIIHGISSDGRITRGEFTEMKLWCQAHQGLCESSPFKEFFAEVKAILDDGTMTAEEIMELKAILKKYETELSVSESKEAKIYFLQGICYGILADEEINKYEITVLKKWLEENDSVLGRSPFKEMYALLTNVMEDGKVDLGEEKVLKEYFLEVLKM
ncbi:hypothetical protein [Aquiflexum gelatinilyticum]|uniref:Uncharacterized protein n=1 Tax=Aquiflexum gelatinilyticum TaxID=2961943 RepID=A0A9X2P1I1_9BACT|nr:hypothetical protein [Aquiflexum gelatinilyticum]MCR9013511.1 hypothetical protein [Aquiflexum gelatinilyticum]